MKTVVLGLGNPILTDDGVGLKVARAVRERVVNPDVSVIEACTGGLEVLDLLLDFDCAIIIDAVQTRHGRPGQVYRFDSSALDFSEHTASLHGVSLGNALDLGRQLGMAVPGKIQFFAIEAENVTDFGEECTAAVAAAVPRCVEIVLQALHGCKEAASRL